MATVYEKFMPGGFLRGCRITIDGTPTANAPYRFRIDLLSGNVCDEEIAFHVAVRFDEHQVVRNCLTKGHWGKEERDGSFPFAAGQQFQMTIICLPDRYKVLINSVELFNFKHRLCLSDVKTLRIEGDVKISNVITPS